MFVNILWILGGLAALIAFSHYIVEAAKRIAKTFGISEFVIGLTIISIGTSLPEIATNISAGISKLGGVDSSGIAVGNIIGSEIGQITLILGLVGLFGVLITPKKELKRDGIMMLIAIVALFVVSLGNINRIEGLILMLIYLGYIYKIIHDHRKEEKVVVKDKKWFLDVLVIIGGCILLIYSANVVVDNGIIIAEILKIPIYIIGLLIGIGTSLPEMAVSIIAIVKKSHHISVGNLIGSNITDPLFSLGAGAVIAGFTVAKDVIKFDIPFLFFTTLLVLYFLRTRHKISKIEATILVLIYFVFMFIKIKFF